MLYKSFVPFSRNTIILHDDYLYPILEASRSNCYVENTGNKADSLHRRIKQTYEEQIAKAYAKIIVPLLKYSKITNPLIAIDFTDEEFYGLYSDLYLHPWTGEGGVNSNFKFAVVSLVGKNKVPILAVPVQCGFNKSEVVTKLLAFAKCIFKRVSCVLLDAGFYAGEVIEALQKEKYLIRAPKNKKIEKFIEATKQNDWKTYSSEIEWYEDRTTHRIKTNIVIVRDVALRENNVDCSYATNIKFKNGMDYVYLYCKRWQIETNFRMEDQVHIKSKSLEAIIRYFYFMVSLLLHTIWLLFYSHKIAFDSFKIHLANQTFLEQLNIDYVHGYVV